MTKEQAYNAMVEGLPVSHKDLSEDEFFWMDENYIIRDEEGNETDDEWDIRENERWQTNWYIYKKAKKKKFSIGTNKGTSTEFIDLISHKEGEECPGKNMCTQYNTIGEAACVLCDCNDVKNNKFLLEEGSIVSPKEYNEMAEVNIPVAQFDVSNKNMRIYPLEKKNIFKKILNKIRRKK